MPEVSLAELLLHVHFVQGSFYVVLSGSEVALIIDQGTCIPCPLFMLCSVLLFKRSTKKKYYAIHGPRRQWQLVLLRQMSFYWMWFSIKKCTGEIKQGWKMFD